MITRSLTMTPESATAGDVGLLRLARSKVNRRSVIAVGGLLVLLLLPLWWWPLVASQDGPCHLYNAAVVNESLAGNGPSTAVYEVTWKPTPNWAGPLLLMVLLKVLPLSLVPHVMLTIVCLAPILATLSLRRQVGRSRGLLWTAAIACCLATGRAWAMGFESFSLGCAAAIVIICLWQRYRERLDALKSLAIAGLLISAFFCHLVPWAFAAGAIGVLAVTGPVQGRARRLWWTAAILITAAPCLLTYWSLSTAHGGGFELDWSHLQGFHPARVRSWAILLARVDCIGLMRGLIPFTGTSSANTRPLSDFSPTQVTSIALTATLFNPFVIMSTAVVLQALGTLLVDVRSSDYRHIGWFIVGFGGVIVATFIPDSTVRHGTELPLRVMLLSLTTLIMYVRFGVGRVLTFGTSLLVAVGFALHMAAVWDFTATANRQLLELKRAAATIPPGQRIYQMHTNLERRFRSDPLLHAEGYVALWSHGILLSNYEAGLYYFHVKLRPAYPQTLISHLLILENVDRQRDGDSVWLRKFLSDHEQFIDVLLVQTVDERILSLANHSFRNVLWHSDGLWVLTRK
jgi:hypothetical protein